jgi:rubredoxin
VNTRKKKYACSVCGWPGLAEPPRSASGGGSYEICPSCGFQFGVTDDDEGISEAKWRARWIKAGMKWSSVARPAPKKWDARRQLARARLKE